MHRLFYHDYLAAVRWAREAESHSERSGEAGFLLAWLVMMMR